MECSLCRGLQFPEFMHFCCEAGRWEHAIGDSHELRHPQTASVRDPDVPFQCPIVIDPPEFDEDGREDENAYCNAQMFTWDQLPPASYWELMHSVFLTQHPRPGIDQWLQLPSREDFMNAL